MFEDLNEKNFQHDFVSALEKFFKSNTRPQYKQGIALLIESYPLL